MEVMEWETTPEVVQVSELNDTANDVTREIALIRCTKNLAYSLSHNCPTGYRGIVKAIIACGSELDSMTSISWNSRTEELVKLLKVCIDCYELSSFDNAFKGMVAGDTELEKLSNVALDNLNKLCGLISGSGSYNFYCGLFDRSCSDSLPITVHFGERSPTNYLIPYDKIFLLIKSSVLAAKKTLSFAESKHVVHKTLPYTSFSLTAGNSLQELLNSLMELKSDKTRHVDMQQLFDTLLAVIEVAPFKRLNPSCLNEVYQFVSECVEERPQIISREIVTPIAVVLLSTDINEAINYVEFSKSPVSHKDLRRVLASKSLQYLKYWSTVCELSFTTLHNKNAQAITDFQILTVLAKHHFSTFKEDFLLGMNLVLYTLSRVKEIELNFRDMSNSSSDEIRRSEYNSTMGVITQALIFLEALTASVAQHMSQSTSVEVSDTFVNNFLEMWFIFFQWAPELMESTCTTIPPAVLDCYAAVRFGLFNQMAEYDGQSRFLASVLSYARDYRPEVRAKAGRCIALVLDYLTLVQDDPHFLLDALDAIEINLKEGDLAIRSTYAWALGNLTDSLHKSYTNMVPLSGGFGFVQRIFDLASRCSSDKPKIRYNAHRTIGYLLRWIPSENFTNPGINKIIEKSLQILIKQVGKGTDFKARWNACHALASILQNNLLTRTFAHQIIGPVLNCLTKGAATSENFKERIQCLKGLSQLSERSLYGDSFFTVWEKVFKAVVISETSRQNLIPNIDKLIEQIRFKTSFCIVHLVGLIQSDDISRLEPIILQNCDSLKELVRSALNISILSPDDIVSKAKLNISRLRKEDASGSSVIILILENVFTLEDYGETI